MSACCPVDCGIWAQLILHLTDVIINFPVQSPLTHEQLEVHEGGLGTWAVFGHVFCVCGGSPQSPIFSPLPFLKCSRRHFPLQRLKLVYVFVYVFMRLAVLLKMLLNIFMISWFSWFVVAISLVYPCFNLLIFPSFHILQLKTGYRQIINFYLYIQKDILKHHYVVFLP